MTQRFNAHFQNGVLIPDEIVDLPENRTLAVVVDETAVANHGGLQGAADDPNDPKPAGGVALVAWRARHRLQVSADIAKILTDPEFDMENS